MTEQTVLISGLWPKEELPPVDLAPERPTRWNWAQEQIIGAAVDKILPEVLTAIEMGDGKDNGVREDLGSAPRLWGTHRLCWDCDSAILDVLQELDVWEAERQAVKDWVQKCEIVPRLPVGAVVTATFTGSPDAGTHEGEIAEVNVEEATYVVFIPVLGHVRTGLGTQGVILPCEQVEAENELP